MTQLGAKETAKAPDRFLFDQRLDEPDENDDVIGCIQASQRTCICQSCGKDDCNFRGSLRMELA